MSARGLPRLVALAMALASLLCPSVAFAAAANPPDFAAGTGRFFTETNGAAAASLRGYLVDNGGGIAMWSEFQRLGGVPTVGYPVSDRFQMDGFTVQAFQKFILQWHPETGHVQFVNVFDKLHDAGKDAYLLNARQTPPPADTSGDTGKSWPQVVAAHQALLSSNAAIKAMYFSDPDPIDHYGLPTTAAVDEGNVWVVRCQRAVFQQWKQDVPWAKAGQVTVANGGDIAKESGLIAVVDAVPSYPNIAWVGGFPVQRDSWAANLSTDDMSGYVPYPGAPGSNPTLQQVLQGLDKALGAADSHGLVNMSEADFITTSSSPTLVFSAVEVYNTTNGARWRFGDLVAQVQSSKAAAQTVAAAPIGDQSAVFRANYTAPSGLKLTDYTVVFSKDNLVAEVDLVSSPGQNSSDDVLSLAKVIISHITTI